MTDRTGPEDNIESGISEADNSEKFGKFGQFGRRRTFRRAFKKRHLLHPKSWKEFTVSILKRKRINFLLVFLIPALLLPRLPSLANKHPQSVELVKFICSFLAIIPLSNLMTIGVEDLSARLGPAYQSVLHALSGNFVELVIEGYALMDGRYAIVRSAILGSILCNITLVLGGIFIVGSWPTARRVEQGKGKHTHTNIEIETFVDTSSSILALAFLALMIPATFKMAATPFYDNNSDNRLLGCNLQNISHATAVVLMMVYIGLLVFQLKTHAKESVDERELSHLTKIYNWLFDLFLIAISVTGISVCARTLVSSIEETAEEFQLGTGFIGVVLLPICVVSNFIEHYQAVVEAGEDKLDSAISLVLNTSVQMALLISPILISVGWIFNKPLTLDFNILEISVLGAAVLIVNYLVADGKAHWLEGYILVISYVLMAIAFFYFPINHSPEVPILGCDPWSRNLNHTAGVEGAGGEGGGEGAHGGSE